MEVIKIGTGFWFVFIFSNLSSQVSVCPVCPCEFQFAFVVSHFKSIFPSWLLALLTSGTTPGAEKQESWINCSTNFHNSIICKTRSKLLSCVTSDGSVCLIKPWLMCYLWSPASEMVSNGPPLLVFTSYIVLFHIVSGLVWVTNGIKWKWYKCLWNL